MKAKALLLGAVVLGLLIVGCDDKSSKEAKEYEVQRALDRGDYEKVLKMTENCGSDEACYMDRAGAYMGKAGFTLPNVIVAVGGDDDEEFYQALGKVVTSTARADLIEAKDIYLDDIIKDTDKCDKANSLYETASYHAKGACFNNGMVTMAQAAVLMSKLDSFAKLKTGDIVVGDGIDGETVGTLADDAAAILNDTDGLDTLLKMFDIADSSDVKEDIEEIKSDICGVGASCTATHIIDYINANK